MIEFGNIIDINTTFMVHLIKQSRQGTEFSCICPTEPTRKQEKIVNMMNGFTLYIISIIIIIKRLCYHATCQMNAISMQAMNRWRGLSC